ncbi:MAG: sodium-dependent transporter [Gammaproteobacteria bacterium]|jgi:NSS family neurotransmitter:Na+ symporter|nr:sodium-dependent transporter [Gammaproteobacteria bacterium]MBP6053408.1 sodium-dependent transporter [Pseudomonadales bacterium]MBK6585187.1 sodium-dependent transporter [Gammaproteobacteria bacterium]MBK7169064.1 sodium-dependent transporter [Gammaproteobacteria bacterium]MBK7520090.1 sodium-dependent transporter [Gammaproteobacteria bacterium]
MAGRGEFSSRMGFILAASGSTVGLGNIWGFPTQTANNGGAAYLLVYLVLAFCLAYPAFVAELIIGRHAKANAVAALQLIARGPVSRALGSLTGYAGIVTASLILSFYSIVAGWTLGYGLASLAELAGYDALATWLVGFGIARNLVFSAAFMMLTAWIISAGVKDGIEKWSARLMPSLLLILLLLIAWVLTLDGATAGLKAYLIPDFSRAVDLKLIVSALGQSFFSLSLGVGTILIYGSYVSRSENLPLLGLATTLIDIGVAVTAGLLIIPAMYVAEHNGVPIYDAAGRLISEDTLVFTVLPALFDTMGTMGIFVSTAFFVLMSIAALTSTISMLEVPVAYAVENHELPRKRATWAIAAVITLSSAVIVLNFDALFGFTIALSTRYSEPLLGLMFCVFAGWIWHRDSLLAEIREGWPDAANSLFWKIWPFYIRFVCPLAILAVFGNLLLS